MKKNRANKTTVLVSMSFKLGFSAAALLALATLPVLAKDNPHKPQQYVQVNLSSDQPDVAVLQDTNLVNSWGIAFSGTGPFWVSDNGTGKATVYSVTNDTTGAQVVTKLGLEVNIPG